MFDRVIVAFGDRLQRRSWKELVEAQADVIVPDGRIAPCRDSETVRNMRMKAASRDLIIVDALLPESEEADETESAAFDLIAGLQAEQHPPACVLVGRGNNRISTAAIEWKLFALLPEAPPAEADLARDLENVARALSSKRDRGDRDLPPIPPPVGSPWALLEVHLNGARASCFRLETGTGARVLKREVHPLALDEAELQGVVVASRALRRKVSELLNDRLEWGRYVSQWRRDYEDLGRRVHKLVGRDRFQYCWALARNHAGEQVRLRFVLDETAYDGLWESFFDPVDEWLMLKSTIARRAGGGRSTLEPSRLDGGDGTVHLLAIASNVPDQSVVRGPDNAGWRNFWNSYYIPIKERFWQTHKRLPRFNEIFGALAEIDEEMNELRRLEKEIEDRRRAGRFATKLDLKSLPAEEDEKPLAEQVKAALTQDGACFDVVHFAGHALFGDDGGSHERGYLVFGGHPHTDMVPISEFAYWLRKAGVKMVYLSCCRSSASRAAFALAREGIPLAIGFTWDLDSQHAVHFARAFYSGLIENDLKVCKAFQSARRQLEARHEDDDPIWTSPVLVAQPEEWHRVEDYMTTAACFE